MITEERRSWMDFCWNVEDGDDPESMEWREELTDEEAKLVAEWDKGYADGICRMIEDGLRTCYCPLCDKHFEVRSNDSSGDCPDCGHHVVLYSRGGIL